MLLGSTFCHHVLGNDIAIKHCKSMRCYADYGQELYKWYEIVCIWSRILKSCFQLRINKQMIKSSQYAHSGYQTVRPPGVNFNYSLSMLI